MGKVQKTPVTARDREAAKRAALWARWQKTIKASPVLYTTIELNTLGSMVAPVLVNGVLANPEPVITRSRSAATTKKTRCRHARYHFVGHEQNDGIIQLQKRCRVCAKLLHERLIPPERPAPRVHAGRAEEDDE